MWRTWQYAAGRLCSHNGSVWKPKEAFHASCVHATAYVWTTTRCGNGMRLKEAQNWVRAHAVRSVLPYPATELPVGLRYALELIRHDAPNENCSCGVYAVNDINLAPPGTIVGKVKLWGKIVPGENGARAEYAYPSGFIVPEGMEHDPGLVAFGVPISTVKASSSSVQMLSHRAEVAERYSRKLRKVQLFSIGILWGAVILNFASAFHWV